MVQSDSAELAQRSVLIVDESDETRQVLKTVLERRGVEIIEASQADLGLELAQRHHPHLIVLDLEAVSDDVGQEIRSGFEAESNLSQTPMVLLGNARRDLGVSTRQSFVGKPYHYGPLIRKIEELLSGPPCATTSSAGAL